VVTEDVAAAVCRILSTAKTRRYVVTTRGVMRILGRDLPQGVLRAVLNKYGFSYVPVHKSDAGKYVVDVESARPICEKIKRRRRKKRPF
jgi:hypothetical protein